MRLRFALIIILFSLAACSDDGGDSPSPDSNSNSAGDPATIPAGDDAGAGGDDAGNGAGAGNNAGASDNGGGGVQADGAGDEEINPPVESDADGVNDEGNEAELPMPPVDTEDSDADSSNMDDVEGDQTADEDDVEQMPANDSSDMGDGEMDGAEMGGNDAGSDTADMEANNDMDASDDMGGQGDMVDSEPAPPPIDDADLIAMLQNGANSSAPEGFWRCSFQDSNNSSLPLNLQLYADDSGAMSARSTSENLFVSRDDNINWMVMDGTLTVQAGMGFSPINMNRFEFDGGNVFMAVLAVPGQTSGLVNCQRLDGGRVPDETTLASSPLNDLLPAPSGAQRPTFWNCGVSGSGGSFNLDLRFNRNGTGSVNGDSMYWLITREGFIRYVTPGSPDVSVLLEFVEVGSAPDGQMGDFFAADHFRIDNNEVSGNVECLRSIDLDGADTLADFLPNPAAEDTVWFCDVMGNIPQTHLIDFNADGSGFEDGVSMTWQITPDGATIRYVRSDTEDVIQIENIIFAVNPDPFQDSLTADHYRINTGDNSIQGFVECQRVLADS